MVKVRDKVTGEVFDVPDDFKSNISGDSVEDKITERGTTSIGKVIGDFKDTDPMTIKRAGAVLNATALPQRIVEAGIANSLMALQNGRADLVLSEFKKGISGEKLGEIGDVYRKAKFPEPVAASMGLVVSLISPLALVSKANKMMKGIAKFTDKGIKSAGINLSKGADDAVRAIGGHLDEAYKPVNNIVADGGKLLEAVDDLPPQVIGHIEKELGKNLDDLAVEGAKISDIREIKQILGKIKPSSFGKAEKGALENISDINVNKSYAKVKNLIQDTLNKNGVSKEAKALLEADEAFTETIRSANLIKKQITDSTLLKPTKAGNVARKILREGDVSTREALNVLTRSGKDARRSIHKAMISIDRFNNIALAGRIGGRITRYFLLGGVAGAVGAKTVNQLGDTGN